jgi:hypothetical protein
MNLPYPALPCRATGCSVPTGLLPCGIYSGPVCRKSEHAIQQIPSASKSLRILAWIYMTLGECVRGRKAGPQGVNGLRKTLGQAGEAGVKVPHILYRLRPD